ncbi:hypothetical protein Hanom_Chr03g00261381 [Helianthus anomalus]
MIIFEHRGRDRTESSINISALVADCFIILIGSSSSRKTGNHIAQKIIFEVRTELAAAHRVIEQSHRRIDDHIEQKIG